MSRVWEDLPWEICKTCRYYQHNYGGSDHATFGCSNNRSKNYQHTVSSKDSCDCYAEPDDPFSE